MNRETSGSRTVVPDSWDLRHRGWCRVPGVGSWGGEFGVSVRQSKRLHGSCKPGIPETRTKTETYPVGGDVGSAATKLEVQRQFVMELSQETHLWGP